MYTKECPTCFTTFDTTVHNKLYCSETCSSEKWARDRKEGTRKKYPNKYFKDKHCRWCSNKFTPRGPSNHYCSDECSRKGVKDKYYLRNYGVGYRTYLTMLDSNNGGCWVCNKSRADGDINLAVDHDHNTGKVRGLLCADCNIGIGKLGDTTKGVRKALEYLERSEE